MVTEFPFSDNETTVFVSAVAHPNAFWVQIIGDDNTQKMNLDRLVEKMNEYYETNKENKASFVQNLK